MTSGWYGVLGVFVALTALGLTIWRATVEDPQGGTAVPYVAVIIACVLVIGLISPSLAIVAPLQTRVVRSRPDAGPAATDATGARADHASRVTSTETNSCEPAAPA